MQLLHRGSVATKVQSSKWKAAHKKVIMLGQEKRSLIVAIFDIILTVFITIIMLGQEKRPLIVVIFAIIIIIDVITIIIIIIIIMAER